MNILPRLALLAAFGLVAHAAAAAPEKNDYPTVDRVLYVQACMQAHQNGHYYEMVNKCSCAFDRMAEELPYDDYVTMSTMANALSIGGERGNVIRDNEGAQAEIKRYRALQAKVQKSCFLESAAK